MKQKLFVVLTAIFVALSVVAQTKKEMTGSLPEVVVTGTGTQHLLKDAPVQTEVISGRMLRNFAGKSIEDILGMLSSSFAFNEDDMGAQMQMNGLGNGYILVMIDGKRLHGDVGGQNDLGLIDPHNIERIEIVKGASSALYGSDAIAGVINIITKKHHEEGLLLENTTRVGSYGDIRQHNGIGLNWGRWSSWTNFQAQHSDGWQNTAAEDPHQTEYPIYDSRNKTVNRHTNWQISERLAYTPMKGMELYAAGTLYWKRIYRPGGKYPGVDVRTYDMMYRNASLSAGGSWKLNKTDLLTLDVDWNKHAYYYHFTDTTLTEGYVNGRYTPYFPYFPEQKELQSDQQRTMAHLKGVFQLPYENRLSAGFEWRYDWLHAPMRVEGGKASDNTEAFYVQDEFAFIKHLQLTAGLRLNRNEQFGWKLSPKLSAMLSLGDLRVRATWSQGFKAPTPKELYYRYVRNMNGVYLYMGNTGLTPQTSDYYALNGEYSIGGLTFTATAYYNKVKDMITLVTIPRSQAPGDLVVQYDPIKVREYQNIEDARTSGIDLSLRYVWKELSAGVGYSYLDTDANQYDTEHDVMQKVIIDGTAHHKGNVFATWNHAFSDAYALGIGLYGRMSSTRFYQINGNGKGYQLWRLTTTHDLGKGRHTSWRIEAGIDNIFNYCDRTPHGLHLGTTSAGRTVYASFTVRFNQGKKLKNNYKSNLNQTYKNEED